MQTTSAKKRLTTKQVCEGWQVTPRTLQNWRNQGLVPYIRINARVVRYDEAEIEQALRSRRVNQK
jgi:predicted site-specific integrase-resolvase